MISIQKKFFKTSSISHDVFRDDRQGAVSLIDIFNLTVTPLQEGGQALEHGAGVGLIKTGDNTKLFSI